MLKLPAVTVDLPVDTQQRTILRSIDDDPYLVDVAAAGLEQWNEK